MSRILTDDLPFDLTVPVAIVGGGAAGLCAALAAKEAGVAPIVFERDALPQGSTALSAGLIPAPCTAAQRAAGIADSVAAFAADIQKKAHGDADPTVLAAVTEGAAPAIDWLTERHGLAFTVIADFSYPGHSARRMHGLASRSGAELIDRLRAAAEAAEIDIVTEARVTALVAAPDGRVRGLVVTRPDGSEDRIGCDALVLACNGYLEKLEPRNAARIMPVNNYMLATEPLPDDLARRLIRDDTSMSDSLFVINYWKLSADKRLLFGGGESYTRRFPADIGSFVRKYMLRIYPELAGTRIDYGWGGTLAITMNRMPDFGRLSANVFYAQGFSGHGVPTATMAGKLLAEVISGTAERFDVMATVPSPTFPGGTLLRWPGQVAGMLFYSLRDRLG